MYNGTFYDETSENGWPYQGGTVDFVARLTDTNGNVWTDTRPLAER